MKSLSVICSSVLLPSNKHDLHCIIKLLLNEQCVFTHFTSKLNKQLLIKRCLVCYECVPTSLTIILTRHAPASTLHWGQRRWRVEGAVVRVERHSVWRWRGECEGLGWTREVQTLQDTLTHFLYLGN